MSGRQILTVAVLIGLNHRAGDGVEVLLRPQAQCRGRRRDDHQEGEASKHVDSDVFVDYESAAPPTRRKCRPVGLFAAVNQTPPASLEIFKRRK